MNMESGVSVVGHEIKTVIQQWLNVYQLKITARNASLKIPKRAAVYAD